MVVVVVGLVAYSFQEPREVFTVPVLVLLARCVFCRHLPLFRTAVYWRTLPRPATGQDQIIFFETKDRMSAKDWKAAGSLQGSGSLNRSQPTTKFSNGRVIRTVARTRRGIDHRE
jgi:hypothetical protein